MACGKIRKAVATVSAPDSYPHVTCGCGHRPVPDVRPADGRRRIVHTGWFCPAARFCDRSRPGLLGYRAGVGGVCRGPNRAHTTFPVWLGVVQPHWSLSARMRCSPRPVPSRSRAFAAPERSCPGRRPRTARRGRASGLRFCHAPMVQGGDGEVPGGADRSGIRAGRACGDPRQPGPAREAGSGDGRHLPLASAGGLRGRHQPAAARRCPPGMTGALPSPPGRCHRASRIGVCRFCDHQVLAGLTGLTRCRQAAAASSPGSDRIEDRSAGMGGTGRVCGVSASGHGLIGRGIVVPFQLRPAGRGVAAGGAAGVTAAARRGWDPGGPGDGRVPVARHDRAGGPVAGVVLLALGAG